MTCCMFLFLLKKNLLYKDYLKKIIYQLLEINMPLNYVKLTLTLNNAWSHGKNATEIECYLFNVI